jgi:predicted dehydrogenase
MTDYERLLSRRDFLKASAATFAAASVGLAGSAQAQEAKKDIEPVKIGYIGVGSEGGMLLSKTLSIPGADVVGICDIYPPHLTKALHDVPGARGYEDYRGILDRKDIQAVVIATPLYLHAPMAIAAMQAGKHVLCEKMMGYTIEDAQHMARTARDTKKLLQIGHQRRYNAMYSHAYKLIQDGAIGKITAVRLMWNRNGSWRRAVPDAKYEKLLNWRMYREYSVGLMAELASHLFHVTNWYLGAKPMSVVGMGGIDYWKDGRSTFDNVNVIAEYPGGTKVYFQSLTTNQYDNVYEQFMGDKGTLIIEGNNARIIREPNADDLAWSSMAHKETVGGKQAILLDADVTAKLQAKSGATETLKTDVPRKDDYSSELESFFSCVREGKPIEGQGCSPQEGLEAAVTCLLANQAMEQGKKLYYKPEMFKI